MGIRGKGVGWEEGGGGGRSQVSLHEKYLKSPLSRGITMWDRIPESVQRSTTKVKFKRDIKPHMLDLLRPVLR